MRVEITFTETSHRRLVLDDLDRVPTGQRLIDLIEDRGHHSSEMDGGYDESTFQAREITA